MNANVNTQIPGDLANRASQPALTAYQKIQRVYYTLRPVKYRQLWFMLRRRLLPSGYRPPHNIPGPGQPLVWQDFSCGHVSLVHHQTLCFLNQPADFSLQNPDWRATQYPKLWRYNLHYFEYLQDALSAADKAHLIDHWLAHNPIGSPDAWEPYPVSLRILNWAKYFSGLAPQAIPSRWLASLYVQGHWLSCHIEFHIDANHLFKNIVALVVWSHYFNDEYAQTWRKKSLALLQQEMLAQFNAEGSHYERSSMYHALVLHFALDAYNILRNNTPWDVSGLASQLNRALEYLRWLQMPNQQIPLLKDSAYGIAPEVADLLAYGARLGLAPKSQPGDKSAVFFAEANYFIARRGGNYLLMDGGKISPAFQPGHHHNDAGHIELMLDGIPIFTDTGVFSYQLSSDRHNCRSTSAHNTLRINRQEQSDIWGQFRLGKRLEVVDQGMTEKGFFTCLRGLANKRTFIHRREIALNDFHQIVIDEVVQGTGSCDIEVFWHLAPGLRVELNEQGARIYFAQQHLLQLQWHAPGVKCRIATSDYFPMFGRRQTRVCLILAFSDCILPWAFTQQIIPATAAG